MKRDRVDDIIRSKVSASEENDVTSSVDINALWDRLDKTIKQKSVSRIPVYYYQTAAAILLVIICVIALMPLNSKKDKVSTTTTRTQTTAPLQLVPKETTTRLEEEILLPTPQKKPVTVKRLHRTAPVHSAFDDLVKAELLNIEDPSTFGMYESPNITAVCYDVKKEDFLLAY